MPESTRRPNENSVIHGCFNSLSETLAIEGNRMCMLSERHGSQTPHGFLAFVCALAVQDIDGRCMSLSFAKLREFEVPSFTTSADTLAHSS